MKRTFLIPGLAGVAVLLLPACAHAHLVNTSCGPFYDGLCHLFVTPLDLMIVLGVSLLAGQSGPASGRITLFTVTGCWLAGAVVGQIWLPDTVTMPTAAAAAGSLVVALLVAAHVRCSAWLLGLLAATIGLCFGLINGAEFGTLDDGLMALSGCVTCVFALTTWVTALAIRNDYGWRGVVVRVAGSWIAAASLLMIGWEFREITAS